MSLSIMRSVILDSSVQYHTETCRDYECLQLYLADVMRGCCGGTMVLAGKIWCLLNRTGWKWSLMYSFLRGACSFSQKILGGACWARALNMHVIQPWRSHQHSPVMYHGSPFPPLALPPKYSGDWCKIGYFGYFLLYNIGYTYPSFGQVELWVGDRKVLSHVWAELTHSDLQQNFVSFLPFMCFCPLSGVAPELVFQINSKRNF